MSLEVADWKNIPIPLTQVITLFKEELLSLHEKQGKTSTLLETAQARSNTQKDEIYGLIHSLQNQMKEEFAIKDQKHKAEIDNLVKE